MDTFYAIEELDAKASLPGVAEIWFTYIEFKSDTDLGNVRSSLGNLRRNRPASQFRLVAIQRTVLDA